MQQIRVLLCALMGHGGAGGGTQGACCLRGGRAGRALDIPRFIYHQSWPPGPIAKRCPKIEQRGPEIEDTWPGIDTQLPPPNRARPRASLGGEKRLVALEHAEPAPHGDGHDLDALRRDALG